MVKIVKPGRNPIKVSPSAYENFYKNAGWMIAGGKKTSSHVPEYVPDEVPGETEDEWDEVMEGEVEKPLSEMNVEELREKAASLGIDLTGVNSPKQIRDRIRKHID